MQSIQPMQQEGIIRRIIQAVHRSLDLEDTFEELAHALGKYLLADRCFVSRYDPEKQILSAPTREYRSSDNIESMLTADSKLWKALCSYAVDLCKYNEAVLFSDKLHGISAEAQEMLGCIKVQSGIGCAVKYNNHCQAVLFVHNVQSQRSWNPTEMEIIEIVAHEAGVAIHQAQLFKEKAISEEQLALHARQQKAVTDLGLSALSDKPILELTNEAVNIITRTLGVPYAKILEYIPERNLFRFKAVVGFKHELVGQILPLDGEPQAYYTLKTDQPIITDDIRKETRFNASFLHYEYNLTSGISVIIGSTEKAYGILQADTPSKQQFSKDDIDFMQSLANLLGITFERKKTERQLAESNRDLEQFAAIASHDLQAPLRKINIFCQQIQQEAQEKLSPQALDLMKRVDHAIIHAQNLVQGILTLSKVSKSDPVFQKVNLMNVIDQALLNLEDPIRLKHAIIEVDASITILGDSLQLGQLIQNLIDNGLKYQPPGQTPVIRIQSFCEEKQFCEISVQDNGIGIDPAETSRIFEPFERLHQPGNYSGTGMGLAICKRIVERHHGSIRVKSIPGQGTTFIVTFPQEEIRVES